MTFIAALRHDAITAPWVIDGPINGEAFRTYIEQVLVPTLRKDDIVILDNLGSHKAPAIRNAIRAAGARLLFLPAYSPDLNPIEQVFAKLKHLLRKAAERSKQAVWRRIGTLLDQFSPKECENYLRNSGYGSVQTHPALDATFAALIGLGMAQVISAVWYHPRPLEIGLGRQLLDHAAEASFPSDHATLLFALAMPLLRTAASRRWGFALLSLGIGAAWSRVYLGVHFPLDMLGAFGVASLAALMIAKSAPLLHRKLYPRLVLIYEAALCRLGLSRAVFPRDA